MLLHHSLSVRADEGGEDAGGGQQARAVPVEPPMRGSQGEDGFSLEAEAGRGEGGGQGQAGQDVVQKVQGDGGGELPAQLVQHQQFPVLQQNKSVSSKLRK